jgi:hypothetical protein
LIGGWSQSNGEGAGPRVLTRGLFAFGIKCFHMSPEIPKQIQINRILSKLAQGRSATRLNADRTGIFIESADA